MRHARVAATVTGVCATLAYLAVPTAFSATLVIANVRIIDTRAGRVTEPRDVVLEGSRIVRIVRPRRSQTGGTPVLDGTGRYLSPGFWDMHAHLNWPQYSADWPLPMFLVAGVTGVRDMNGDCFEPQCRGTIASMRSLQADLSAGTIVGPRLLAISSAQIHGPRRGPRPGPDPPAPAWVAPGTAADARHLVAELKARGVDSIKPYDTLPREAFFALMNAAKIAGLDVSGHVPMSVTTLEAVQAGLRTIEHAKHPLIDCAEFSDEFHRVFAEWASGHSNIIYRSWARAADGDVDAGVFYPQLLSTQNDERCRRVIAGVAASGAYYVPTLITRRFEALADEAAFLDDARLRYVPPEVVEEWRRDSANYQARFARSPDEKQTYMAVYERAVRLVADMSAAGVPVMVGTDGTDSYCFPGSGVHDEMRELRRAGLSNAVILRAATWTAAQFQGATAQFGSIEAGKTADLVLLAANPLDDIDNASRVEAVILGGRLFDRNALTALEQRVERYVGGLASSTSRQ